MDEFGNPKKLISPDALRELSMKSDGPAVARLFAHFAALTGTGLLVWSATGTAWVIPAMFIHGVFVVFLFTPHHECIHQTAFKSPWLTKIVNWVLGLIVFYPPEYFRFFHLTHHRFTQDRERDPEIVPPPVTSRAGYIWWVLGAPYLKRRFSGSLKHALTGRVPQPFVPDHRKDEIVLEARITWVVYTIVAVVAAATEPWAPVLYWLGPYVLAQPLFRLYQLGEHGGTEYSANTIRNTRTTISNRFVRWLAWNMPYHTEHHLYPGVPFHALPKLHQLVKAQLQIVSSGYLALNWDIWNGLAPSVQARDITVQAPWTARQGSETSHAAQRETEKANG